MKTPKWKDRIIATAKLKHGGFITKEYESALLRLPEGFDIEYNGFGDVIKTIDDQGDEVYWDDDNNSWSKVNA